MVATANDLCGYLCSCFQTLGYDCIEINVELAFNFVCVHVVSEAGTARLQVCAVVW